jgi:hypothetical protein
MKVLQAHFLQLTVDGLNDVAMLPNELSILQAIAAHVPFN